MFKMIKGLKTKIAPPDKTSGGSKAPKTYRDPKAARSPSTSI